jgi:hypothetical protein
MKRAVTSEDVRRVARALPRSEEHFIRGRIKFRVGRIVYLAFSRDKSTMGFAFPKEWRAGLVEAEPDKFFMPEAVDLRYNWVCVRLTAIGPAEMQTLVTEAWRMVVPAGIAAAHLGGDMATDVSPRQARPRAGRRSRGPSSAPRTVK